MPFILVSPDGERIVATAEVIPGERRLHDDGQFDEAPARDPKTGEFDIAQVDETTMRWNEQETRTLDTERVFIDAHGGFWKESELTPKEID